MAKKKLEKAPETDLTTDQTTIGSSSPAPKRGRSKKTELAAEMGVPVTSETKPAEKPKRQRAKAVPVDPSAPKTVRKSRATKVAGQVVQQEEVVSEAPQEKKAVYHDVSRFTEFDIYLFKEGRHFTLYDKFGSHPMEHAGQKGAYFAVWAPNAERVTVIGDFNHWNRESHSLKVRGDGSGIWEGFIPDLTGGELYKYHIKSNYHLYHVEKSDPFAFAREKPPQTASRICDLKYEWNDSEWLERRRTIAGQAQPMSVYEVHLGSWRRRPEDNNRPLTYHELAEELPQYVKEMGFTHVEFMPVMHHPFQGSWGYQITGYFAAASVYGSPGELMYLIDVLHQHGIGVILDWVPSHFPSDEHGLAYFDGTHLYEHADPRKGYHPDWNSYIFNYGRNEVRSFLISNALFWLEKYHIDGLRVDAVASMLYLDYSRKEGEWIPNEHGGRENLEAISLIKDFNQAVHERFPDVQTIAEESTAWPAVTGKVNDGGLGFDMKWMMGWMHDTLHYFSRDPIYRKHHQGEITFSIIYAFSERFMLPLSHDEVVHGKGSLIRKMPGDEWQQFANLRTLYSYMYAHPGTKLMFMGGELAQGLEWNHDSSLDWHLLEFNYHSGIQRMLQQLNKLYQQEPALYELGFESSGFEWVDFQDAHNSVISFLRKGKEPENDILIVCNFTPIVHQHYRLGVPTGGEWVQIFNSDDEQYGGSNVQNHDPIQATEEPSHGRNYSLALQLPPLAVVYFKLKS